MNAADQHNLLTSALRWIRREVEAAQESEDADPWLVLEDIDLRCEDTLTMIGEEVAR